MLLTRGTSGRKLALLEHRHLYADTQTLVFYAESAFLNETSRAFQPPHSFCFLRNSSFCMMLSRRCSTRGVGDHVAACVGVARAVKFLFPFAEAVVRPVSRALSPFFQ